MRSMSDIFSGTQPPAWLQERAQRDAETARGAIGNIAGTLTSGFLNGLGRDPNAAPDPTTGEQPRKGFSQGLWETRMNQQDPMWKLKTAQIQSNITTQAVHAEAAHALAQERIAENQGIMHDLPSISGMAAIPASRWDDSEVKPPADGWKSKWAVETFDKLANQKSAERIAIEKSKSVVEYADRLNEFDTTLYTNPLLKSQVATLPNGGMIPTPDGKMTPSPDAWSIVNQYRVNTLKLPPIGASKATTAAMMEQQKEQGRQTLWTQKGQQTLDQIAAKNAGSIAAWKERGQQMQDLEKLRFSDRTKRDAELQAFYSKPPVTYPGPTPNSFIVKSGRATYIVNPKTNRDMSLKGEFDAATSALKNAYVYKQAAITSGKTDDMAKANQMVYEAKDAMLKIEKRASAIARPATGAEIPADQTIDAPDNEDQSVPNPSRFKVLEVK